MSEASDSKREASEIPTPISNRRILWLMGAVIISGTLASLIFISRLWSLGFLIGGILSFLNFFWLKSSLRKMFVETSEGEHKPHYSAARYISRYFTLAAILAVIFLTQALPIASVIFGLVSLAFAILIEAFIRIFSALFKRKEL
jgi:hypothetical protein